MKTAPFIVLGVFLTDVANAQNVRDSMERKMMLRDSVGAMAQRILDDPGMGAIDVDAAFEYLDGLSAVAGAGLERFHADPQVSWVQAHAMARARSDSGSAEPTSVFFRSRESQSIDAEAQQGFIVGTYLGEPLGLHNEIRLRSPLLQVSAIEQKAPWEPNFTEHTGGFAMLATPIVLSSSISMEEALVGDYNLAVGNGLAFGDGYATSASRSAANAAEARSFGVRGSLNESARTLRGAMGALRVGPGRLLVFASDRSVDASVVNDTIQAVYYSALHQTQNELDLANAATIRTAGARVEVATSDSAARYLKGGLTGYALQYDHPFAGTSTIPFIGNKIEMVSADLLTISEHWSASGEVAVSVNDTVHRTALSITSDFSPSKMISFSMLYMHVPEDFHSPYGEISGVGISGLTNFDGYYIGLRLQLLDNRLRLNSYANVQTEIVPMNDLFGKQKYDYLASALLQVTPHFDLRTVVRDERNATTISDSSKTGYMTVQGETLDARLEASYRSLNGAEFRSVIEEVQSHLVATQTGWSVSEDARIPAPAIRTEFHVSVTRFQAAASVSKFEWSTPGSGAINTLEGLGWRIGLRAITHPAESVAVSVYLAGTIYDTPRTLGTGLSARTGTTDLAATAQLDLRL